ncbi:solute carrier family 23 protein [Streptomyces sp. NPDC056831]|uniref:solute carrier family 23 protein n=1 Tax=Streptomyces sp. NPDC056831 TaxID=3345954 RepID=UPI003674C588
MPWAQGGNSHAPDYGSLANLGLAGLTLLVVLLFNRFLRGFLQRISILLGMLVGTLVAVPFGKVDTGALSSLPAFELAFGGVFNGFICSAFAQNIRLVALTRIRSRFVVALSGVFLVVTGLVPVVGGLVSLMPQPVLGGAGVVLFGSVAVAGIRTLSKPDLSAGSNAIIVAVSLAIGIFPIAFPDFYRAFPEQIATVLDSGISVGCLLAVTLNLLFNGLGRGREVPPAYVPEEQVAALGRVGDSV